MAVWPDILTTFPPQLSESFFSLFLTCVASFPTGRFRTRSSDDRELSSRGCQLIRKESLNDLHTKTKQKPTIFSNNNYKDVKEQRKKGILEISRYMIVN